MEHKINKTNTNNLEENTQLTTNQSNIKLTQRRSLFFKENFVKRKKFIRLYDE